MLPIAVAIGVDEATTAPTALVRSVIVTPVVGSAQAPMMSRSKMGAMDRRRSPRPTMGADMEAPETR
jgi:hypothetical protein